MSRRLKLAAAFAVAVEKNKIYAIKRVRQMTSANLMDAKRAVEEAMRGGNALVNALAAMGFTPRELGALVLGLALGGWLL